MAARMTDEQRLSSNSAKFSNDLMALHRAATSVIVVRTREPARAERAIDELAQSNGYHFFAWDHLHGWNGEKQTANGRTPVQVPSPDPSVALAAIVDNPEIGQLPGSDRAFYTLTYLHRAIDKVFPTRLVLKEYARILSEDTYKRVILIMPLSFQLPEELQDDVVILDFDPPSFSELRDSYEQLIGGLGDRSPSFSEEEVDAILSAGSGMTAHEFVGAVSRALVGASDSLPNAAHSSFIDDILKVKTELVKRSEVLELMPSESMDNIGGLDNLKDWLRKRAKCLGQDAQDFGIDSPKGISLLGPPGCVAGDTIVGYRRGLRNSSRPITVKDLYDKFNGVPTSSRPWDSAIDTALHSWDAESGKVFYNYVSGVYYKGRKECITVTTAKHGSITLTLDHPVLNSDGEFVPAGELRVGDALTVRGSMRPVKNDADSHSPKKPRVVVEGLKYYSGGWSKTTTEPSTGKRYHYRRQHKARLVVEAHMNGVSYDEYLRALRDDPYHTYNLTVPTEFDVHHIDENPSNDEPTNLQVILRRDHQNLHNHNSVDRFNVEYTVIDSVESIQGAGVIDTYDIAMDDPCANFVVNEGIIVHNTGKSLVAKATASLLGLPLIKFDVSRVFNSLVGKSEERVAEALSFVDAMAPCVLMLDEIDKALNSNSSSGDSGVGDRILGKLLTWMQETKAPVFVVVTANYVENIDPALIRRGRMDEIFSVSLPSEEERLEVLNIHLRKRGHNPAEIDGLATVAKECQGYVPAEIEAAVKDALIEAFTEDVPVTGGLILQQLSSMVPISVAFKDRFDAMDAWAAQNAKPANRTDRTAPVAAVTTVRNRNRSKGVKIDA